MSPSILIAYEDRYCGELHPLLKALRRDAGLPGLVLEAFPVEGTGNFAREVSRLIRLPLKQTRCPPDRLLCVADADRPKNLLPGAPSPPQDDAAHEAWVCSLERAWKEHLVTRAALTEAAATRLRTHLLRWNKESLLIACPEALLEHAEAHQRRDRVESLLRRCTPSPLGLPDARFVADYQAPMKCMDLVIPAIHDRPYKKGVDDDDLLRLRIRGDATHRARLAARCPDLGRLLAALALDAPPQPVTLAWTSPTNS